MPKRKSAISKVSKPKLQLSEEVIRLLTMEGDEFDFSDDPLVRKLEEAFEGWSLEERRRWAEEWREEHRKSK
ncbi:MAG: hypothetical protein N3B10_13840 [Armatimonadetes bacterium]|nr:hypothetical protein [Armatimonadota bacterium]